MLKIELYKSIILFCNHHLLTVTYFSKISFHSSFHEPKLKVGNITSTSEIYVFWILILLLLQSKKIQNCAGLPYGLIFKKLLSTAGLRQHAKYFHCINVAFWIHFVLVAICLQFICYMNHTPLVSFFHYYGTKNQILSLKENNVLLLKK
jgi:hypothetical protein